MTIITLRDVETNEKVIVRSVIDPIAKFDEKGEVQIIPTKKWIFDETDDFVPEDYYGTFETGKIGMYVTLQYEIIKIEIN
ncbi:hypothetical protein EXE06_19430 [Acinetobacter pittii]|uniref:hypothetical protein n=1 Tax=Acinetobacter pittii TaxID=48296 RepID=UPI00083B6652|nr:hypothetical protein [Acinetobacter pittii]TDM66572.1 hypothetical protein C5B72_03445 [Acinetobacter sp. KU 011TH]TDM67407.1 hypothetical protein C4608_03445 [Acinetobacter sp. KU 013TH]HCA5143313.1 hypothetical protein [Acinetobacter baumannii]MBN6524244.1 hypothetical protein [Acinetobacter pittii]OCZ69181.1 hypothetical protein A9F99_02525 [Acinetobacter pittii]